MGSIQWCAALRVLGQGCPKSAGVQQLFDAMKTVVDQAAPDRPLALIRVHPDLANMTQRAAGLTAGSSAEQNGAGLDRSSDAEFQTLSG